MRGRKTTRGRFKEHKIVEIPQWETEEKEIIMEVWNIGSLTGKEVEVTEKILKTQETETK